VPPKRHTGYPLYLWQSPHNAFKCNQCHRIRWKRPQKTWQETPPIPSPSVLGIDGPRSGFPVRESPHPIVQPSSQWVRHDSLLNNITRIARYPEYLGTQPSCPKIDCRRAQTRPLTQQPSKDIVGPPPLGNGGVSICLTKIVSGKDMVLGKDLEIIRNRKWDFPQHLRRRKSF
jgi:hypothetical protein